MHWHQRFKSTMGLPFLHREKHGIQSLVASSQNQLRPTIWPLTLMPNALLALSLFTVSRSVMEPRLEREGVYRFIASGSAITDDITDIVKPFCGRAIPPYTPRSFIFPRSHRKGCVVISPGKLEFPTTCPRLFIGSRPPESSSERTRRSRLLRFLHRNGSNCNSKGPGDGSGRREADNFGPIVHVIGERTIPRALPMSNMALPFHPKARICDMPSKPVRSRRVGDAVLSGAHHKVLIRCSNRNAVASAKGSEVLNFSIIRKSSLQSSAFRRVDRIRHP